MMLSRALALVALTAAMAACGSPTITSAPDAPADAPVNAQSSSAAPKPRGAHVGDAITLKGNDPGAQVAVKLVKVIDKGRPANEFVKPEAGKRLFAVEIILKNTGTSAYRDSPSNGASVVDAEGQQYEASLVGEIAGTHPIGSDVSFSPGDSRRGVITFEVPTRARIATFAFALDSGFADQKGEWSTR